MILLDDKDVVVEWSMGAYTIMGRTYYVENKELTQEEVASLNLQENYKAISIPTPNWFPDCGNTSFGNKISVRLVIYQKK
jgi:hypothetical protein